MERNDFPSRSQWFAAVANSTFVSIGAFLSLFGDLHQDKILIAAGMAFSMIAGFMPILELLRHSCEHVDINQSFGNLNSHVPVRDWIFAIVAFICVVASTLVMLLGVLYSRKLFLYLGALFTIVAGVVPVLRILLHNRRVPTISSASQHDSSSLPHADGDTPSLPSLEAASRGADSGQAALSLNDEVVPGALESIPLEYVYSYTTGSFVGGIGNTITIVHRGGEISDVRGLNIVGGDQIYVQRPLTFGSSASQSTSTVGEMQESEAD